MVVRRFYALTAALAVSCLLFISSSIEANPGKSQDNQPSFRLLQKWDTHVLEVDAETKHSMKDKDGDVMSGAVFRITPSKPQNISGVKTHHLVNIIVAACGKDTIAVIKTILIDGNGNQHESPDEPRLYSTQEAPAAAVAYAFLCEGQPKANPFGRSMQI